MSSSIKNVYQFRTTSKITQAQGVASTFTIGNDVFTNSSVTITGGSVKLENRTGSQVELMTITATGGTATIATRGILPDGTTSTNYQYERPRNTLCTVTVLENQIIDKTASEAVLFSAKVYADTTARDAALGGDGVATKNYTNVKTTADGLFWRYNTTTNVWEAIDTGTVTPNASQTVAGKKEDATLTEGRNGTLIGGTGATLGLTPDLESQIIQEGSWLYGADAGGDDTYVIALTPAYTQLSYVTGMKVRANLTTANTGACTLNVGTPGAIAIKTIDGNDPQTGAIRSGLNEFIFNGTNRIWLGVDFSTTSNRGINTVASDANVATGTDEVKTVNCKQLRVNSKSTSGKTSRNTSASTGTQNIAHGLGVVPRLVEFKYVINGSVTGNAMGVGSYNGTTNYSLGIASGTVYADSSTLCINHHASTNGWTATCTVDETNIILSWTKVNSGINTEVLWTAHA